MEGSYTDTYTMATNTTCLTAASVSSTTITYGGISGSFTIAGGNAGALPGQVCAPAAALSCERPDLSHAA